MTFQNFTEALLNPGLHLSKELILSQISESRIWKVSLGFEPNEKDCITSPYRKDSSPGCRFSTSENGLLVLTDGAAIGSKVNGVSIFKVDCFQSLQILNNIPLNLVLSKLQESINNASDINLGAIIKTTIIATNKKKKKESSILYYWERPWNKWDKEYWSPYGITRQQLNDDFIFPINAWGLKKDGDSEWKKYICSNWCSYVLNDESWGQKVKIYQPFSKSMRFFGNVDNNCIGGLWDITDDDSDIIITKSYKDWRVLKNQGLNVIWFQNEGMLPDLELLAEYKHRKFIILFDNDKAGIKAAYYVRNKMELAGFNVTAICLNRKFLSRGIKDSSDLRKEKKKVFNYIFNKNGLRNEQVHKTGSYKLLETIPEKIYGL
jgi:hypothetical protein